MLKHIDYKLGELELDLCMDNISTKRIEKSLGKSLMGLLADGNTGGMRFPTTEELLTVLAGANKKRGIVLRDVDKAYWEGFDKGTVNYMDVFQVVADIVGDVLGNSTEAVGSVEAEWDLLEVSEAEAI